MLTKPEARFYKALRIAARQHDGAYSIIPAWTSQVRRAVRGLVAKKYIRVIGRKVIFTLV